MLQVLPALEHLPRLLVLNVTETGRSVWGSKGAMEAKR